MSHGATSTLEMAFPNKLGVGIVGGRRDSTANSASDNTPQPRSFASTATATEKNNSTNGNMSTAFGSRGNAWGSSSVWAGGIFNGMASTAAQRGNSVSRGVAQPPLTNASRHVEGKTGSGILVESSVCDEYGSRTWGASRNSASSRSIPRFSDNTLLQQRGINNVQANMVTTASAYTSRPSMANSNSTAPAQARPSFGSAHQVGTSSRGSESAPFNVYTKFDRPSDPMSLKKHDSGSAVWSSTPSPTDERRPQFPIQHSNGRTPSMPTSRDGSDPPSRDSDQKPVFQYPQYEYAQMRSSSREPSISSKRNATYNDLHHANGDQMGMQFGQLSFNADSRPSTSHRSPFADGYSNGSVGRSPMSYSVNANSSYGSVTELPRLSRNNSVQDEYSIPQQPSGFSSNSGPRYTERFQQSGGAFEFRPGHPYQSNSIVSRPYELSRQPPEWSFSNGASSATRRSAGLPEQHVYHDPRVQQYMATQYHNPYAMYNEFAVQNALHLHAASPYQNLLPFNMNMIMNSHGQPAAAPQETLTGEGVQSALMYEFKSNTKSKRYELCDIYDHIAEFSGDQHGSRFIQTKLETANSDEKQRVFQEIEPNAIPLMTDVFGNYVIQKFFEHGDQTHKKILANKMRGHVLQLSLQMYGCRVVQKALDHVLVDQQAILIGELENHITKCVKDQNGNHVIQKAIERCPPATIEFIIAAFRGQVQQLSIHAYGCRVIQRCLEKCDLPSKAMIMSELLEAIPTMISDQFGNYVVQHIVAHDDGEGQRKVMYIVARGLEGYSKHKFASNVVEKCLERGDDAWRRNVVLQLARAQQDPRRMMDMSRESEGVLVNMIKDNFGNYVIQKLLDTVCRDDYFMFLEVLRPAMVQARRSGCGKQVLSIEKKMHRFEEHHNGLPPGVNPYGRTSFQLPPMSMGMPAPPFATSYDSAATTPPALTADTQSLQSSRVPSVNGDAIEGASAIRKGSEQSNDFY